MYRWVAAFAAMTLLIRTMPCGQGGCVVTMTRFRRCCECRVVLRTRMDPLSAPTACSSVVALMLTLCCCSDCVNEPAMPCTRYCLCLSTECGEDGVGINAAIGTGLEVSRFDESSVLVTTLVNGLLYLLLLRLPYCSTVWCSGL